MITSNGYTLDETSNRKGWLEPVPDDLREDREALWGRLREDGYLYLKQQLSREAVEEFREHYFAKLVPTHLLDSAKDAKAGLDSGREVDLGLLRKILFDDIVPGPFYEAITNHPSVRGWFEWFYGEDVHLHKRKIIRHVRPGEKGIGTATQAHYDLVYLREGTERVLSMWIPLGDCPVDMGGLTYLEGSHHRVLADERAGRLMQPRSITADLPSLAEKYDTRWLFANYEAGDVMVHSAHIIHAGTDNVDDARRIRLSTDIRYQKAGEPIDWRWQEHWRDDDGL